MSDDVTTLSRRVARHPATWGTTVMGVMLMILLQARTDFKDAASEARKEFRVASERVSRKVEQNTQQITRLTTKFEQLAVLLTRLNSDHDELIRLRSEFRALQRRLEKIEEQGK